jgi:hypothetical protein
MGSHALTPVKPLGGGVAAAARVGPQGDGERGDHGEEADEREPAAPRRERPEGCGEESLCMSGLFSGFDRLQPADDREVARSRPRKSPFTRTPVRATNLR